MRKSPLAEEEVHALIGTIVLEWGHIEAALANIIICLNHPLLKRATFERVPHTFARKRTATLRGYCEAKKMASIRKAAIAQINAIVPLFEKRSVMVHGTYQGPTGWKDEPSYLWHILDTLPNHKYAWTSHNFPETDFLQLADDMAKHRQKMDALAKKTYEALHAEPKARGVRKPQGKR